MHHGYILKHLISTCSLITALYFQSCSLIRAVPPSNGQGCVTQPDNCDLCVLIVLFRLHPPSALHSRCTHSLAHTRCDAAELDLTRLTGRCVFTVCRSQPAARGSDEETVRYTGWNHDFDQSGRSQELRFWFVSTSPQQHFPNINHPEQYSPLIWLVSRPLILLPRKLESSSYNRGAQNHSWRATTNWVFILLCRKHFIQEMSDPRWKQNLPGRTENPAWN